MSPLQAQKSKKTTTFSGRLTKNSRLFKAAINAILEKKGENIVSLDLRKIPEAVADFFIICEASNPTQVKAIADYLQDEIKRTCGEIAHRHEGYQNAKWILVDYINLIVHVMQREPRAFYQLEEMWSDAPLENHFDEQEKLKK